MHAFDVAIIGAGIVGCAAARFLSAYDVRIAVLDSAWDVCCGASKANSGILHAGFDCVPGTQKAALNVEGLAMHRALADELEIPCKNNGSLVVCHDEPGRARLHTLLERGRASGVTGLELLDAAQARALEPNLHHTVCGALLASTAGIISPYEATIALAQNAAQNGATFVFDAQVCDIADADGAFLIHTAQGVYRAQVVINAAGLGAAHIHNMICTEHEEILMQRGEYYLLDNTQRGLVAHTIFQLPSDMGKGVLVVPTVDGNILLGPTATDTSAADTATTTEGLQDILTKTALLLREIPIHAKITTFSGIRAKHASGDFQITEPKRGFIGAIGIDSPGLTAAPAIAHRLADMALAHLPAKRSANFVPHRKACTRLVDLGPHEQDALVRRDPAYGRIICRCETVTEHEIVGAIRSRPGARCLDGIKRRTRAQMGRCGGGFCTPGLIEILAREAGIAEAEVTKSGPGSPLVQGILGVDHGMGEG